MAGHSDMRQQRGTRGFSVIRFEKIDRSCYAGVFLGFNVQFVVADLYWIYNRGNNINNYFGFDLQNKNNKYPDAAITCHHQINARRVVHNPRDSMAKQIRRADIHDYPHGSADNVDEFIHGN